MKKHERTEPVESVSLLIIVGAACREGGKKKQLVGGGRVYKRLG